MRFLWLRHCYCAVYGSSSARQRKIKKMNIAKRRKKKNPPAFILCMLFTQREIDYCFKPKKRVSLINNDVDENGEKKTSVCSCALHPPPFISVTLSPLLTFALYPGLCCVHGQSENRRQK